MNMYNPRHAVMLALTLSILLAGCSFPVDGKTPPTPTYEITVLLSVTPTTFSTSTAISSEAGSTPLAPSPMMSITPTFTATPDEHQEPTSAVDQPAQQPIVVPVYTELIPTIAPVQPDAAYPENLPNNSHNSVDTPQQGENQETAPAVEQPTQEPLVIDGVIFPESVDPTTYWTPTPRFIDTLE